MARTHTSPAMRGGLALAERWAAVRQSVAAVPAVMRVEEDPANPLKGVQWNPTLVGFLLYLLVITSFRLPIGDLVIVMALGGILFMRERVRFPSYLAWFSAFWLWALLTAAATKFPGWVSNQLQITMKVGLIVFVAANALRTRAQIRLYMVVFLGCFALFPLRGAMFNFFLYRSDMGGRAIWNRLYSNPNDLAAMALLQLSMALALLATEKKGWVRWSALAGVFALPMLILMTQSRGVFVGLTVFMAIVFAGQRKKVQLAMRLAVVVAFLAALAPSSAWERIGTLTKATDREHLGQVDGEQGSTKERYEIWQVAFSLIGDSPLTGVGLGAYKPAHELKAYLPGFNRIAWGQRDTHSLYFNVLAETGVPGLLLYLGMLLSVIILAEKTRRRCKGVLDEGARQLLLLEAGVAGFLTSSIFGTLPYLPHFLLHLVLLYAVAMLYRKRLDEMRLAPVVTTGSQRQLLRLTS